MKKITKRQQVTFIATKFKRGKPRFSFYTLDWKKVNPALVKRSKSTEKLEFYIEMNG